MSTLWMKYGAVLVAMSLLVGCTRRATRLQALLFLAGLRRTRETG